MTRTGGLGRGLSALIPAAGPGQSGLLQLRLSSVTPNRRQPRGVFDEQALEELAQSFREVGVLQPILVRPMEEGRYEIIAGERRYRAARLAGLEAIPALVRHSDDTQLLTEALVENVHRTDLNPLEEAAAYQQLLDDFGFTHDELADRLAKSRSAISNSLRLLTLSPVLQHQVAAGALSAGHARALLGLPAGAVQERVANQVVAEGLSVRATETLVRELSQDDLDEGASRPPRPAQSRPFAHLQRRLTDVLATRVRITGSARRGRLVIDYAGGKDLERLLAILGRGTGEDLLHDQG